MGLFLAADCRALKMLVTKQSLDRLVHSMRTARKEMLLVVILVENDLGKVMRTMGRAFRQADDGKLLKRELSQRIRKLGQPLAEQQRARVRSLPSRGHQGQSMRQAIARQTKVSTRWGGRNAGVSIIQRARSMPRGFNMAGRMFNRGEWHPTTLAGEMVTQHATPASWFDQPVLDARPLIGHEVRQAIEDTAAKIARSARG